MCGDDIMFGDKIQQLRKEYKVSQEQLAEVMSTTRQAISKWERGESYPDLDRLKELAIYFNVSIDYLLDYDIEATSVKNMMARIDKANKEKTCDISSDEIKLVVSKNYNNFGLIHKAVEYLIRVDFVNKRSQLSDLVLEYSKRLLEIYPSNKNKGISLLSIQKIIILYYTYKERYDLAKEFISENEISGIESTTAEIEFELGNYDEAAKLLSSNFINSVLAILNGNMTQAKLFIKRNQVQELYDLSLFSISLIKSIQKREDLLMGVVFQFTFFRAMCEHKLGMDYSKSVDYLIDSYKKGIKVEEDSTSVKFYYNETFELLVGISDIKDSFEKAINSTYKGSELRASAVEIFNQVFDVTILEKV